MNLDAIILSNTANIQYYNLLEQCIESIKHCYIECNIIVVETNSKLKNKDIPLNAEFIFPDEPFNYNRFLNHGLNKTITDTILISNNDIVYDEHCIDMLYTSLNTYDSVSPWDKAASYKFFKDDKEYIEGNDVGKHVTGYSIMFTRKLLDTIGKFDEQFKFWYQDNDYCNLLKKYNLKHAMITKAKCYHYGSQSHPLIKPEELYENTNGLINNLNNKWKDIDKL